MSCYIWHVKYFTFFLTEFAELVILIKLARNQLRGCITVPVYIALTNITAISRVTHMQTMTIGEIWPYGDIILASVNRPNSPVRSIRFVHLSSAMQPYNAPHEACISPGPRRYYFSDAGRMKGSVCLSKCEVLEVIMWDGYTHESYGYTPYQSDPVSQSMVSPQSRTAAVSSHTFTHQTASC